VSKFGAAKKGGHGSSNSSSSSNSHTSTGKLRACGGRVRARARSLGGAASTPHCTRSSPMDAPRWSSRQGAQGARGHRGLLGLPYFELYRISSQTPQTPQTPLRTCWAAGVRRCLHCWPLAPAAGLRILGTLHPVNRGPTDLEGTNIITLELPPNLETLSSLYIQTDPSRSGARQRSVSTSSYRIVLNLTPSLQPYFFRGLQSKSLYILRASPTWIFCLLSQIISDQHTIPSGTNYP
jgi:hypothetical protein